MCQNSVALSSAFYRYGSLERGGEPVQAPKPGVLSLVDRATRTMRSFTFDKLRADAVYLIVRANVARGARLMTEEARMYPKLGEELPSMARRFMASARQLATDNDPDRFKERVGKLVKHKPVEKPAS